ncbi:uncharacterized protein LOC132949888 [Metopolophium dirhodum]|uniref:uncharacterized protein LOC132949888 n=1 Tax=Metopolophium dirhodum TaxID=44670 RepID=UPI00298FB7A1|nr:uncharacterized protein LOC132949888 [Metopolophium dirhodum]
MNIHGSNSNRIFNQKLAKIFGFYQILDTETVTFLGRHNVYYRIFVFLIVCECLFSAIACLNGLNYIVNNHNIIQAMVYFGFVVNALYGNYKMYIILNNSKVVWDCFSITNFDFTSYGIQGRHTLTAWRNLSIKYTNKYSIFFLTILIMYVASPVVFSDSFIIIKNHDGSSSAYRLNLLNLYLFVSEETYNTYFYVFHIFESLGMVITTLFIIIFDTIVNTLALALTGQLQMISTAFESVGHKSLHFPNMDNIDNKNKLPNENIKYMDQFNDLKTFIIDHQNILKKYDEFLSIFQPTMLLQIFVVSCSIIFLWFILLTSFMEDDFTEYMAFTSVKAFFGIPFCTSQVYMSCFIFTTLNTKKDSITFALYSSNWTEMDMKCKKLILSTMRLNDAHQQKLQYTRTRIINMEIFYQTMRVCYTIVNVMINCKKEKLVQQ